MSFSQNSKNEILDQNLEKKIIPQPFIYGLYLACGELDKSENKFYFLTDLENIYPLIKKIFKKYFKNNEINIEELINLEESFKIAHKNYYKIEINYELFLDFFKDINFQNNVAINCDILITNANEMKSFCIGAFLGCATSSIKISSRQYFLFLFFFFFFFQSMHFCFILHSCYRKYPLLVGRAGR